MDNTKSKTRRIVIYECTRCREPIIIDVLGDEKVGKVKLRCPHCGFLGSYYGEKEE